MSPWACYNYRVSEESNHAGRRSESRTEGAVPSANSAAENIGRSLGRLARSAQSAVRSNQPEAKRLAKQALEAGEAALPHVKRASRAAVERAGQFVRDNNADIQRAAATGASLAAGRSGPILRPVIFAVADEVNRKVAGLAPQESGEPSPAPETAESPPEAPERKDVNLF